MPESEQMKRHREWTDRQARDKHYREIERHNREMERMHKLEMRGYPKKKSKFLSLIKGLFYLIVFAIIILISLGSS